MTLGIFNHPLLLLAAGVVAIGVVVYEIVTENRNRQRYHTSRRSPPSPPPDDTPSPRYPYSRRPPSPPPDSPRHPPSPPPDSPRHPNSRRPPSPPPDSRRHPNSKRLPPTDSPKSLPRRSNEAVSDSKSNGIRKRILHQSSSKESSSTDSKSEVKVPPVLKGKSEASPTQSSQNINDKKFDDNNYSLNVLDKCISDTKNIDESLKDEKSLTNNIYKEESDSSEDNLLPKNAKKINQVTSKENVCNSNKTNKRRLVRKAKHAAEKSRQNHTKNKSFVNSSRSQNESDSDSNSDHFAKNSGENNKKKYPDEYSRKRDEHENKNLSTNCKSQPSTTNTGKSSDPLSNLSSENPKKSSSSEDLTRYASGKNDSHSGGNMTNTSNSKKIGFDPLLNSKADIFEENSSSEEDNYKEEVHDALMKDLCNEEDNFDSVCSPEKVEEEKSTESKFCHACEEKPINTRAYPCTHSFLCADCAVKIFRVYKKCSICLADVVKFVQFETED